jgi:hypothetical protein
MAPLSDLSDLSGTGLCLPLSGGDPTRGLALRHAGKGGVTRTAIAPQPADILDGLHDVLDVLDSRCPDHVEDGRWRHVVQDGRRFLATWGAQALALGWTVGDLFGLHTPPENPHPSYRRLSRYDETGLIWLLQGCEVPALTAMTATIRRPSGSTTTYRKHTPTSSARGDGLDGLQ